MGTCPQCGDDNAEGIGRCVNCDAQLVSHAPPGPDPDPWVEIYAGPPRWRPMVEKALDEAGIKIARPEEREMPGVTAYWGPDMTASVFVRDSDSEQASGVLEKVKQKIPEAFPEGEL